MEAEDAYTKSEIIEALGDVEREVASFFGALSADEFVGRVGEAWNPAEHLSHLNTSVSAVARGFSMPKLLIRLRFGRAREPSRGFAEVRRIYRNGLAAGGGATGRFVPAPIGSEEQSDGGRSALLARWARVNARLRGGLGKWREVDLDRIRMPHPLLGLLTTREMLFFTIYHNRHHIDAAKRRLPRFAAPDPAAPSGS